MPPSGFSRLARMVRARVSARRKGAGTPSPSSPRAGGLGAFAPRPGRAFLLTMVLGVVEAFRGAVAWLGGLLPRPAKQVLALLPPDEFLNVGHRGAPAVEVENTLPSFDRALADGANAVECDVCVTRDDRVVVWHDWDPDERVSFARQCGAEGDVVHRPVAPPEGYPMRRPVRGLSLEDLRAHYGYATIAGRVRSDARIPLLEDVVAWARAQDERLRLVLVDLKVPPANGSCVLVVVNALKAALRDDPPRARFVLMTPHLAVLQAIRELVPTWSRTFDVELKPGMLPDRDDGDRRWAPYSAVRYAVRQGNDHASIGRPRFTWFGWSVYAKTVASDLRQMEVLSRGDRDRGPTRLLCWTINRPREVRRLLRLGVHGILSDYPERVRADHAAEWERQQASGVR